MILPKNLRVVKKSTFKTNYVMSKRFNIPESNLVCQSLMNDLLYNALNVSILEGKVE